MKTKLLFWGAVLFLALGANTRDSALCYFFSIHLFMLFIGVFIHKHTSNSRAGRAEETPPQAAQPASK
jgi:hypothetical protein